MRTARADEALEFDEAVHLLAHLVPSGSVLSYGDVAELLQRGGARQTGKAMSTAPEQTPWWRIIRADGTIAPALHSRAEEYWDEEQTPRKGHRVNMAQARWIPTTKQWQYIEQLQNRLPSRTERSKLSAANDQL